MRWRQALALLIAGCGSEQGSAQSDIDAAAATDTANGETFLLPSGDGMIFPTEDTGASPEADAALPPDYPLPAIPTTCARTAEVITYDPNGWDTLVDAFEANVSTCANYFIHLPAIASDKTQPRGPTQPAGVRARKGRFFAVAEFHYGAWAMRADLGWFEKGVEFRKRMDAAGYNVMRGDTWAINELPSTVRTDASVRTNVKDLVRGLYTGPSGAMPKAGIVFVINMGHETTNFTVYKPALKTWSSDGAFFTEMNKYVRYWGQETYTSATKVCVTGATVAGRADRVNAFTMHPARLVSTTTTPTSAALTRTFFNATYFPLMTAFWKSTGPYGDTNVTLDVMKHLVSLQVYSTRLWLDTHAYPDGRLGFAWDESAGTAAERTELATRLAQSIRDAYAPTAGAARACSPTGAYTWCDCSLTGAAFNDAWSTFATW
jgi:hypothetical protein